MIVRGTVLAGILVIVALAGAAGGYLYGMGSGISKSSSIQTTSCIVFGPTIGAVIRVVEGTSSAGTLPVAGAVVSGYSAGYCNNVLQTQKLASATTNSSGWASLKDGGFGIYNLNVTYDVGSPPVTERYSLSISMQPTTVTYVIFNTTTGNVTTHTCEYDLPCFHQG